MSRLHTYCFVPIATHLKKCEEVPFKFKTFLWIDFQLTSSWFTICGFPTFSFTIWKLSKSLMSSQNWPDFGSIAKKKSTTGWFVIPLRNLFFYFQKSFPTFCIDSLCCLMMHASKPKVNLLNYARMQKKKKNLKSKFGLLYKVWHKMGWMQVHK